VYLARQLSILPGPTFAAPSRGGFVLRLKLMADIILNVEVRERTGTGGARAARRNESVPGVLYGGDKDPVAISVKVNEFRKALYTGKLLGHLVTLKYGKETQPVIAKDVQFHPVSDQPIHFDLYRVDAHQEDKISIPVHFAHQDACPAFRQGAALEVVRHDVEILAKADHIPEELVVDMTGRQLGDTIRLSDIQLPEGVKFTMSDRDAMVATISGASTQADEDEAADAATSEEAAAESTAEAAAEEAGEE
jgi:large subunit ribosomal protein L25